MLKNQHSLITEKARKFQKSIYYFFIDYTKAFDPVDHNKQWKILQEVGTPEPDMEQRTGSKLGKAYVKAVCCHPAYLTYMQSTSCEMLDWMKYKLESRLQGEISITSDVQMTPPNDRKRRTKEPLDESERGE